MKYDIPTLLALSRNARIDAEKFSSQAASNNLLRRRKANASVLSERPANRSREASGRSLQSDEAPPIPIIHLRRPSRQPHDPPQGVRSQSDGGFARFLKEHSSPKHQRVTAGGRIVPMNPLTPAPKMKLPVSLQGMTANNVLQSEPKDKVSEQSSSQIMETEVNPSNYSSVPLLPTGILPGHTRLPSGSESWGSHFQIPGLLSGIPSAAVTPAMILQPNASFPTNNQHIIQPERQSLDYFSLLPNASAYGFGTDQISWPPNASQGLNGQATTVPFMPASNQPNTSVSGSSSEFSTGSNLSGLTSTFNPLSTGFDPFYQNVGFNQPVSFQNVPQEPPHWKTLEDATKEYGSLSAQLSRLDRYMAVHTWDLDPRQKRLLVEQRMSLVRELDAVRSYKEQLSSLYGQLKSSTPNIQQQPPTDAQAYFPRRFSGNAANTDAPLSSRMAGSTAPHTASTKPAAKSATASSKVNTVRLPSKPVCQLQNKDNKHSSDVGNKPERTSTNERSSYESKPPVRDRTVCNNPNSDKKTTQTRPVDQNKVGIANSTAGWTTPTQPAPPEIRRIYSKIEEATRRGASIEGLLQELASVTRRLVQRTSEDSNGSPRSMSKSMHPGKCIRGEAGTTTTTRGFPKSMEGRVRSARLASRRQWASENQPRTSVEPMNQTSYETDEDDDGDSWSSYVSTTDSWDTIQEGDERWVERELLNGGNVETNYESSRNRSKYQDVIGNATKAERQVQKNRDTLGWIQNTSPDRELRNSTSDSSKVSNNSDSMKQNYSPLLTQYFSRDRGLGPQKSTALAVSQNVNAHACLPHFDGAGDTPGSTETNQISTSQNDEIQAGERGPGVWYLCDEDVKPRFALLRRFFPAHY